MFKWFQSCWCLIFISVIAGWYPHCESSSTGFPTSNAVKELPRYRRPRSRRCTLRLYTSHSMSQWACWLDKDSPPSPWRHQKTHELICFKDHDCKARNGSVLRHVFREPFWRCLSPEQDFAKNLSPSKRGKASEINGQVRLAQHK